jgi:hypothetical protein
MRSIVCAATGAVVKTAASNAAGKTSDLILDMVLPFLGGRLRCLTAGRKAIACAAMVHL